MLRVVIKDCNPGVSELKIGEFRHRLSLEFEGASVLPTPATRITLFILFSIESLWNTIKNE